MVVEELMRPVKASIFHTQSVHDAAHAVTPGGALVVRDLSHRPIGLITEDDIMVTATQDPESWTKRRCAHLMRPIEGGIHRSHSVDAVMERYRQGETYPMLVFDGDSAVGVLYPSAVFQWSAGNRTAGPHTSADASIPN